MNHDNVNIIKMIIITYFTTYKLYNTKKIRSKLFFRKTTTLHKRFIKNPKSQCQALWSILLGRQRWRIN